MIALDEGIEFDEQAPAALRDRLAFHVDLTATRVVGAAGSPFSPAEIAAARRRLPHVRVGEEILRGLCAAGEALGIASVRAVLLAANEARAAAALAQRDQVSAVDAAVAGRLVLVPRATVAPPMSPPEETDPPDPAPRGQSPAPDAASPPPADGDAAPDSTDADCHRVEHHPVEDVVLAAAQAAIPPRLLAQLRLAEAGGRRPASQGR
ncbi:MAG: magnesium chelatase ATPase subunit D, partial [Stellaceae bacterium]